MIRSWLMRATLVAAALVPLAVGAQPAAVPRPELKVGDRWKLEEQDPLTKLVRSTAEEVVTSIGPEKIGVAFDGQEGVMTPDLTLIDNYKLGYDIGYQFLRFPLEVGKKWSFKTKWTNKQTGSAGTSEFDVEVLPREGITVPAGTFDAVKLRAKGYMYRGGTWVVTITYWYAPAAKRIVRMEWRDNKRDLDYNRQLVEFKVAE